MSNPAKIAALLSALAMGSASLSWAGQEWTHYGADAASTKFADVTQVDSTNFDSLRIIWRHQTADQGLIDSLGLESDALRSTPIVIDDVLYTISPLNRVSAIDAATGRQVWTFDPEAWKLEGFFHGYARGLSYWTDGQLRRILFGTSSSYLYSLDADTGQPDPDFGDGGCVDLASGLSRPIERRHYAFVSPPAISGDVAVVGSSGTDWRLGRDPPALVPPGDVRGFDVRTGKQLWTFHSIPHDGEAGAETWAPGAWQDHGAANVWSMMTVDEELGYVYLPHSTPDNDFYGGERPGDNLFGESLVCLNARTGERVWHYQFIHHGLWDYDIPAAPILLDIVVDGRPIKAVAQVTKQAWCFVFNRVTGEPVWPIEEQPVPQSTVPGEHSSPTQPEPTRPAAFDLQGLRTDDLIDFTPELRRRATEYVAGYVTGPLFTPPALQDGIMMPGTLGGADWSGAAVDPYRGLLFVPSKTVPRRLRLREPKGNRAVGRYRYIGDARRMSFPWELPLTKPPYSRITAIDLNTGQHRWVVPVGRGPKDHPAIRHLNLPDLGWGARTFVMATPNLLLATGERVGGGGDYWRRPENVLRAFDPLTGRKVGQTPLPDYSWGAPMTCTVDGRQMIIVPVGRRRRAELVALAIPRAGEDLPPQLAERHDAEHTRFYDAVALIDSGDVQGLRALLQQQPALVQARGFTDSAYGNDYFRGARLLHLVANNPTRRSPATNTMELTDVLLAAGADVDAQTDEGNTVLSLVVTSGELRRDGQKTPLLMRLLAAGADPAVPDGRTINNAFTQQRDQAVLQAMAQYGMAWDPLRAACMGDLQRLQGFFDDHGALRADAVQLSGRQLPDSLATAQHVLDLSLNFAAKWNQVEAMALLVAHGADVNARPTGFYFPAEPGATALHRASNAGAVEAVHWLLDAGADPSLRDLRWDDLPGRWARYSDHPELQDVINAALRAQTAGRDE